MTNQSEPVGYQTRHYSAWRATMSDALHVAKEKNYIYGLLEIDVTEARRRIHDHEAQTGEKFSFTAFLLGCIALAVDENKAVHALRQGNRLIIFDDVDVTIQVEHDLDGEKVVSAYIVRAANRKTARQMHDEIRAAQQEKISADAPIEARSPALVLATHLPSFVRRIVLRWMMNNPFVLRRLGGTVNLTSIGMAAKGGGWGIAIAETGLAVTVGGIDQAVRWIDGQACMREMLSITLGFDHDIVDGSPAARFAARMKALIEAAHGLEALAEPEPAPADATVGA